MSNPGGNGSGGGGGQNPPPPPQVNLVDILMKAEENHQIQNQLLEDLVSPGQWELDMSSGTVVMLLKVMEPDGYDDDVIMMIMFLIKRLWLLLFA